MKLKYKTEIASLNAELKTPNILINPQWITSEISLKIILLFLSLTFLIGSTFIKEQLMFMDLNSNKNKITPIIKFVNKQSATNTLKLSIIIGACILLFS